ncbi:DUF1802 family protein [Tumebacillus permanentifrigoris]|uniref:DUF1802 family protein n=1 Tax=Tumebacillus permanentifrigoris TaxID=378543 RepID=A0A316D691_9BACL|nr:DUF1802 family protein [Tumebacillus permanentifrigoris]PWK07461.1 hypothetical protein C7459_11760 [Tumebacillus permanentifrigoris]
MSVSFRSFSVDLHSPHLPIKEVALKEWAVCIEAIARGEQVVLIRKGGITEETQDFRLEEQSFYLYPTYEHQNVDLIKPAYRDLLQQTLEGRELPPRQVTITHVGHVTDDITIKADEELLKKFDPYHILTPNYAQERLQWQADRPLHILLLRAYRLSEPKTIKVESEYSGCKSWLKLDRSISNFDLEPVIAKDDYLRQREEILRSIGAWHADDYAAQGHS